MIVYATPADLGQWAPFTDQRLPEDILGLMRSASIVVAMSLNESLYNDSTLVTEPKRDAACAQATSWIMSAIDPAGGAADLEPQVTSRKIDTASISYQVLSLADRDEALKCLAPDAYNILFSEGLLWEPVPLSNEEPRRLWRRPPVLGFGLGSEPGVTGYGDGWRLGGDGIYEWFE